MPRSLAPDLRGSALWKCSQAGSQGQTQAPSGSSRSPHHAPLWYKSERIRLLQPPHKEPQGQGLVLERTTGV